MDYWGPMVNEIYFFDLPVYRLSPADYDLAREKEIAARRAQVTAKHPGFEIPDSMDQAIRLDRYQRYGEWHFNEVIAYIRLHFSEAKLMATYHSAKKDHNPISRSKVFTVRSRGINLKFPVGGTSAEIWATIKEYVETCKKQEKKWFIDDSTLMRIGPHIDWQAIQALS